MKIEEIINNIMAIFYTESYLSENTIKYYEKLFKAVIKYFHENNCDVYNQGILKNYLDIYIKKNEKNLIKNQRLTEIKRIIFIIESYLQGNDFLCPNRSNTKKYIPSNKHDEFTNHFLDSLNYSIGTYRDIYLYLRFLLCLLDKDGVELEKLNNELLLKYYLVMTSKYTKELNNVRLAMKLIVDKLNNLYHLDLLDINLIKLRNKPRPMINPYTKDEIDRMLTASFKYLTKRDYAIFLLAISTGLRAVDIKNMKIENINWDKKIISIIQSKTGKENIIPVSNSLLNAIADYILNERPDTTDKYKNYIFLKSKNEPFPLKKTSGLNKLMSKLEKCANIKHINGRSFHSCGRYFATELVDSDIDIYTISQLLGHSDLSTDKRYISFNRKKIFKCAMNFSKIPIKGGVYFETE